MNFKARLKKNLSQDKLTKLVGVHFTQVSRYERGETNPNAQAMTKLAQALDTTVDYLMSGNNDDIVNNAGLDKEIISRFKQLKELEKDDRKTVLSLMDAFIAKTKIQHIIQHQ